jgi:hypothetical protein
VLIMAPTGGAAGTEDGQAGKRGPGRPRGSTNKVGALKPGPKPAAASGRNEPALGANPFAIAASRAARAGASDSSAAASTGTEASLPASSSTVEEAALASHPPPALVPGSTGGPARGHNSLVPHPCHRGTGGGVCEGSKWKNVFSAAFLLRAARDAGIALLSLSCLQKCRQSQSQLQF